jgi:long-chain acyl-CoA synthetase
VLQLGAVLVPIYPTITEEEYEFILNDGEVKYIFVEEMQDWSKKYQIYVGHCLN